MERYENLLVTVSEECAEIHKAVSKALRFGLDNHHPDKPTSSNADEIMQEFIQLCSVIELLQFMGRLPTWSNKDIWMIKRRKCEKIAKWQEVSYRCKTLQ